MTAGFFYGERTTAATEGVNELGTNHNRAVFPSLHHGKEGWTRDKKISRSLRSPARTVVFRYEQKENHPVGVGFGGYAIFSC